VLEVYVLLPTAGLRRSIAAVPLVGIVARARGP
jgi:hypothetical protein